MKNARPMPALISALGFAALLPATAVADSGFYLGVGAGAATVEVDIGDAQLPILPDKFDEDDTAYKIFGGYNWQLTAISLGIEGAYNNFGKPGIDIQGVSLSVEPTGLSLFGVAAIGLGPVDLYGKAGVLAWDADAVFDGSISTDDGTDPAYGLGVRVNFGPAQIRGEYEIFDVDDADLTMLSVGIAYRF